MIEQTIGEMLAQLDADAFDPVPYKREAKRSEPTVALAMHYWLLIASEAAGAVDGVMRPTRVLLELDDERLSLGDDWYHNFCRLWQLVRSEVKSSARWFGDCIATEPHQAVDYYQSTLTVGLEHSVFRITAVQHRPQSTLKDRFK